MPPATVVTPRSHRAKRTTAPPTASTEHSPLPRRSSEASLHTDAALRWCSAACAAIGTAAVITISVPPLR